MFNHILIPTGGSKPSFEAIGTGIDLARRLEAKITVLVVLPEYRSAVSDGKAPGETHADFLVRSTQAANEVLDGVRALAKRAGVECDGQFTIDDQPCSAVIHAVKKSGCDLIFMASREFDGQTSPLHCSDTQNLLDHCTLPVLVYR